MHPACYIQHMITTTEAINQLLFIEDSLPAKADLVFVVGGRQLSLMDPAIAIYQEKRAPRIMISGNSSPKFPGYDKTECEELSEYAIAMGVDEKDLILESKSTNTLENFTYSKKLIEEILGWDNVQSVIICCKGFHSRRVLMTAQKHWPSHIKIYFQTLPGERLGIRKNDWWLYSQARQRILEEVERVARYTLKGDIGDFKKTCLQHFSTSLFCLVVCGKDCPRPALKS
jgi:uncharacterized SAM-binding protein YcdF (DUF218 family)